MPHSTCHRHAGRAASILLVLLTMHAAVLCGTAPDPPATTTATLSMVASLASVDDAILQALVRGGLLGRLRDEGRVAADARSTTGRLLEAARAMGIVAATPQPLPDTPQAGYRLTALGDTLARLQSWIALQQHMRDAMTQGLLSAVAAEAPAASSGCPDGSSSSDFYGSSLFDAPETSRLFAKAMLELTELQLPQLLSKFDWPGSCTHVCDIGGGSGRLAAALLQHGVQRATVLDISADALRQADEAFAASGLAGGTLEYDAFEVRHAGTAGAGPLPGCDCVTMKGVTSDYSDSDVRRLLAATLANFGTARYVFMDHFFSPADTPAVEGFKLRMDIMMLGLFGPGSRQRSCAAFSDIAAEHHLRCTCRSLDSTLFMVDCLR